MRAVYRILMVVTMSLPLIIGSCKKQDKCGCDGDMINNFEGVPVNVYYDEGNKTATFQVAGDPYSRYNFCNPTEMMDKLKTFESGSEVLIDCEVFWDCNYMYQASNSSYNMGGMYKVYSVTVSDLRENLYGK